MPEHVEASERLVRCEGPGCEVEFVPYRPQHRFHDPECRRAAWQEERIQCAEDRIVGRLLPQLEALVREIVRGTLRAVPGARK